MPTVKKIKKAEKQWFKLSPSVKVFTDDGIKECTRFYFNGFEPTYELTFSDGCKYKFTGNHRLKNIENLSVSFAICREKRKLQIRLPCLGRLHWTPQQSEGSASNWMQS